MANMQVLPATPEQEPILANLLELYAHDFSEFFDVELGEDGRFGYRDLSLYWREQDRYPLLARVDGKVAGFALVKREHDTVWDMAEFFVLRGYRRNGIGTAIAHEVWRCFPGRWKVRVMERNESGLRFWERAIAAFAGEAMHAARFEKNGLGWRVFSFESL